MTPEPLSASGRSSEKMSLPTLQSKMKCDPEGYETELLLVYNQFKSSLELFKQQADLGFKSVTGSGGSDPTVAKDLADRALFLAHVTPFYPARPIGPIPLTALRVSALLRPNASLWSQIACCSSSHSSYEQKGMNFIIIEWCYLFIFSISMNVEYWN